MKNELKEVVHKKMILETSIRININRIEKINNEIINEASKIANGKRSKEKLKTLFFSKEEENKSLAELKYNLSWVINEINELENEIKTEE